MEKRFISLTFLTSVLFLSLLIFYPLPYEEPPGPCLPSIRLFQK